MESKINYSANLTRIINATVEFSNRKGMKFNSRMWQRFVHSKQIHFHLLESLKPNQLLLNKLLMLHNISIIKGVCSESNVNVLKPILAKNGASEISNFNVNVKFKGGHGEDDDKLYPIKLAWANYITLWNLYFDVIWSNKLETLELKIKDINSEWCKHVIDKCDCGGIKNLYLFNTSFNFAIDENDNILLCKLANKFKNLENFKVYIDSTVCWKVLLFWQLLQPIIIKNNTKVAFIDNDNKTSKKTFIELMEFIGKRLMNNYSKLVHLSIYLCHLEYLQTQKMIKENKDLELLSLNQYIHEKDIKQFESFVNFINDINYDGINTNTFSSLQMIYIKDCSANIKLINEFLMSKIIMCKKRLCICIDGMNAEYDKDEFKLLCKNVYLLLVTKKSVPMELDIMFDGLQDATDINYGYYQIFQPIFNAKTLAEYNEPLCNSYCQSLKQPNVSFKYKNGSCFFRASNAARMEIYALD